MPASSCRATLWPPSPLTSSGQLLLLWRLPSLLQTRLKRCAVHCCSAAGVFARLRFNALDAGYPLPELELVKLGHLLKSLC